MFWDQSSRVTIVIFILTTGPLIKSWGVLGYPVRIDDSSPPESLPCSVHTFVRPLDRFPPNFESRAKAGSKGFISPVRNEQSLLNCLLGMSLSPSHFSRAQTDRDGYHCPSNTSSRHPSVHSLEFPACALLHRRRNSGILTHYYRTCATVAIASNSDDSEV